MKDFSSLSDENWLIVVDEYDINSPTICYRDQDRRGAFVGPLATVHVGCTSENDDGDEVLEVDGADGRNLFAIACLPQLARLLQWIRIETAKLGVSDSDEYNNFVDTLRDHVEWIEACINDRDMEICANSGPIGFERHP